MPREVHARAAAACKNLRLSQREVERRAGVGHGTISRWRKETPRADHAARVASVLGRCVGWLLCGHERCAAPDPDPPRLTSDEKLAAIQKILMK